MSSKIKVYFDMEEFVSKGTLTGVYSILTTTASIIGLYTTIEKGSIISPYNILQVASTKGKYTIVRAPIGPTTLTAENKKSTVRSRINAKYCIT